MSFVLDDVIHTETSPTLIKHPKDVFMSIIALAFGSSDNQIDFTSV